jgi:murein DD-endopeptidase MepM/ murein hydrolase activator NlpD
MPTAGSERSQTLSGPVTPRRLALGAVALALAGCGGAPLDWDLRTPAQGTTAEAARQTLGVRPAPDARGVISYPGYQVAVARRGDTVSDVARRLQIDPGELARLNALNPDTALRDGEVLALPGRVGGPGASGGADVGTIATAALDRVGPGPATTPVQGGPAPVRHTVLRGETAFSIARLYNVTPRALADWNGLGADMAVREGQTLLIPVAERAPEVRTAAAEPPRPGAGSPTPAPPSAAQPMPTDDAALRPAPAAPASPDLGAQRTQTAAATRLSMPADGPIIREFQPGRTDGISIGAPAGSAVRAAADGTVATITRDTQQTQIVILRHSDNLLTVYANVDEIRVERGQQVSRGDRIGSVQRGDPAFLLFQVRRGIESVDPMPFLR